MRGRPRMDLKRKNIFFQFLEFFFVFQTVKYSMVFWQLFLGEENIQPRGLKLAKFEVSKLKQTDMKVFKVREV